MRFKIAIATAAFAGLVQAAVPPDIAEKLVKIGRGVCVPQTDTLYRPLQAHPPYPGVKVERDVSFGPDEKNVMDILWPEKGGGNRPVLVYISGGAGNKTSPGPDGTMFYDNIMLWAVKNGMTGVNMQRRNGGGMAWDDAAKDVGKVVEWVHQNIAKYKGNPNRVFLWAQSAGTGPTSMYVGHPELYGPNGVGIKGVVLMSAPNFNILPVAPPPFQGGPGIGCNNPDGSPVAAAGGPGGAKGKGGGGGGKGAPKGGPGGPPQVDAATQLARSNLPGLEKTKAAILLASAELDPPGMTEFNEVVKEQLCKAGKCPTVMVFKAHSHVSEVYSPNTPDDSVTGPILKWMKSVK